MASTTIALAVLACVTLIGTARRPALVVATAIRAGRALFVLVVVTGGSALSLGLDERLREALGDALLGGWGMPIGQWFVGPSLPLDAALLGATIGSIGAARLRLGSGLRTGSGWRFGGEDVAFAAAVLMVVVAGAMLRAPHVSDYVPSDAAGYEDAAMRYAARLAETGWNPVAFTLLKIHPAGREPLFPFLLRLAFDAFGERRETLTHLSVGASLLGIGALAIFGAVSLSRTAGICAAVLYALLGWDVVGAGQGLREDVVLCFLLGLGSLAYADLASEYIAPMVSGALGAAAVLTRLDSGGLVLALFALWMLRTRRRWRPVLGVGACGALLLPFLAGNWVIHTSPLAQMGAGMGGDIRSVTDPLLRFELPLVDFVRYVAVGTWQMYARDLLLDVGTSLTPPATLGMGTVALGSFVAGFTWHALRGRRDLCALALVGSVLPPFAFIAGTTALGIGGGYVARYTYLILAPALVLAAWAPAQLLTSAWRRTRAPSPATTPAWRRA
jgi:hypothetical protein